MASSCQRSSVLVRSSGIIKTNYNSHPATANQCILTGESARIEMNISFYYRKELGQTAVLACSVQNLGKFVVMWKQDGRVISGEFGCISNVSAII